MKAREKHQLELLAQDYEVMLRITPIDDEQCRNVRQEKAIIDRIANEVDWGLLSDEAKQEKRKMSVVLLEKVASEDGYENGFIYENSVIRLYELIHNFLSANYVSSNILSRLKAMAWVEKFFINEKKDFSSMRHMDYFVWNNLIEQAKIEDGNMYYNLKVNVLNDCFVEMYCNWPKRPYKEVL